MYRNFAQLQRRHAAKRGVTIVEMVIAMGISVFAMTFLAGVVVMAQSSLQEGIWENNLRGEGALFMEQAKQKLTFAFRQDALLPSYRPVISSGKNSITFTTPDDDGDSVVDAFFMGINPSDSTQLILQRNGAVLAELNNVNKFFIDAQEGLLTFMITIQRNVSTGGRGMTTKQFTLVGRALPRNMGQITLGAAGGS